jgi:hypothetical protein
MDYVLISFRSRTDASSFKEHMKFYGENATLISTPKDAGVGCGLSVKISLSALNMAKKVLKNKNYSALTGIFLVSIRGGHSFIKVLY